MRKVTYVIGLMILASSTGLLAQQMPQYTQYMFNDFVINPAVAGVYNYYQIRTNHRFQWVGLLDPPMTNSIPFYGPHAKLDMGYGGYVYNDVTGPTSRTGITGSYAYNIAVTGDIRLSMGLSASVMQYRIDGTQLNPADVSDPSILSLVSTSYQFYVDLSAAQLLNNNIKIFDNKDGLNRLKTHFNLIGAYHFWIDENWLIEPSLMVKGTAPKELGFDITARIEWKQTLWTAVSYRYSEAVGVMLGYSFDKSLFFGYAYDIGISDLRKYNTGSHEVMIGYRFNDIK